MISMKVGDEYVRDAFALHDGSHDLSLCAFTTVDKPLNRLIAQSQATRIASKTGDSGCSAEKDKFKICAAAERRVCR